MSKKKFTIPQKEHSVSLSPGNVATRRPVVKAEELGKEDPLIQARKTGPALDSPQADAHLVKLPTPAPASPGPLVFVPEALPPSLPPTPPAAAPDIPPPLARKPKLPPVKKPAPKNLAPKSPTLKGPALKPQRKDREGAWPPAAPAPGIDPLSKTMPVGSAARVRLSSLRSLNAQLRQELERLESTKITPSQGVGEFQ
jgi:hypothetical protein